MYQGILYNCSRNPRAQSSVHTSSHMWTAWFCLWLAIVRKAHSEMSHVLIQTQPRVQRENRSTSLCFHSNKLQYNNRKCCKFWARKICVGVPGVLCGLLLIHISGLDCVLNDHHYRGSKWMVRENRVQYIGKDHVRIIEHTQSTKFLT